MAVAFAADTDSFLQPEAEAAMTEAMTEYEKCFYYTCPYSDKSVCTWCEGMTGDPNSLLETYSRVYLQTSKRSTPYDECIAFVCPPGNCPNCNSLTGAPQ